MGAPFQVLWEVDDTTARNALVISQLQIGNYVYVRAGSGAFYQAIAGGSGSSCWAANQADDDTRLDAIEVALPSARAFGLPALPITDGLLLVSNKAYWAYLGYFVVAKTVNRVRFHVATAGAGTQAAEVALASSPAAPNRANQVLTKLGASGSLGDLTGTGLLGNSSDLGVAVAAGTHLWAGIRTAMSVTQPTLLASAADFGQGAVLSTAAAGVLTGAGPWTGAVITHALTAQAPILVATLD